MEIGIDIRLERKCEACRAEERQLRLWTFPPSHWHQEGQDRVGKNISQEQQGTQALTEAHWHSSYRISGLQTAQEDHAALMARVLELQPHTSSSAPHPAYSPSVSLMGPSSSSGILIPLRHPPNALIYINNGTQYHLCTAPSLYLSDPGCRFPKPSQSYKGKHSTHDSSFSATLTVPHPITESSW